MNWKDLLKDGLIEYIDVEEEDTIMIAMMVAEVSGYQRGYWLGLLLVGKRL